MDALEAKALRTIGRHHMFEEGDNVIVALSGGADSVALFHFLLTHREKLGINLAAAHLEHGMRGERSVQDMAYVRSLCAQAGVGLYVERGRMNEREKPRGIGVEEWGRLLRYAFFERLAGEHGAKIAMAHTLSDNAETVLFRAIRGTGPRGLAGIPPVRDFYVRPLLEVSRSEVESYCKANNLAYIHDYTNDDVYYSRNSLRHEVMPLLEKAHPGAAGSLARMAGDMRDLDQWLTGETLALLEKAVGLFAGGPLMENREHLDGFSQSLGWDAKMLAQAPAPLRLKALAMVAGPKVDRTALDGLQRVLTGELGAVQLPGGKLARVVKGRLYLRPAREGGKATPETPTVPQEHPLREGMYALPGGYYFRVQMAEVDAASDDLIKSAQKGLTFVADYDKISRCSVFRGRKAGDSFSPARRGVTKPLRKWMNEACIPPWERDTLPLLADGSKVLWVWDYGFAHGLAPDENTTKLLFIDRNDHIGGI